MNDMDMTSMDRRLLVAGSGTLQAALVAGVRAAGMPGTRYIPRSCFTIANDFVLPKAQTLTQLPLSVTTLKEGTDVTLQGNGRILINTSGQYRVVLGVDWGVQNDTDVDRRTIGIRRWPGSLLNQDDRLASVDIAGRPGERAQTRGESNGGRQVLHTATEDLMAGQVVYAVVRSNTSGDHVQATRTTFLQIERFA